MERLFDFKNTIDDSVRAVTRDFIKKKRPELLKKKKAVAIKFSDDQLAKIGTDIMQQANAKVAKPVHTNTIIARKATGGKRKAAFDMYHSGASAGDVAKTLCITYANAHYYKRAFKKEFG
jgi:tRNA A37 threonylcarbamoyladenosine dehydratase